MEVFQGLEHFVTENEPLAAHTWLRLGGPAEYFAEPTTIEELTDLVKRCQNASIPIRMLGGGSNLLVRDEGVSGVVVHLSAPAFCEISVTGNQLRARGGARVSHVISTAVREGLGGIESLVGLPGTIGGALRGNAGGSGVDIGQYVVEAEVMARSGEIKRRQRGEISFTYRYSSLDELVILQATLELEPQNTADLTQRMQKLWIQRKAAQPTSDQPCGQIFKSPGGISASSLIEEAGLKGASIGGAQVSDRNANYIVAQPGATSGDVLRLIDLLRDQVLDRVGVELEIEIKIW